MRKLTLQSLKVAIDGGEEDGLLVRHDEVLVGVLVCLDDAPMYGVDDGKWHLEASFGKCAARAMIFPNLAAALRWMAGRLGLDPDEGTACAKAHLAGADGRTSS